MRVRLHEGSVFASGEIIENSSTRNKGIPIKWCDRERCFTQWNQEGKSGAD